MFFNFHLELESGNNICNSIFKKIYYASKVKEAVHIRIHPNNISGDDEIEIPEASMLMIKKHNNRSVTKGNYKGTKSSSQNNYEYRNEPIRARHSIPITTN